MTGRAADNGSGEVLSTGDDKVPEELAIQRHLLDRWNRELFYVFAQRFKLTDEIGNIKARLGLPSYDGSREAEQIETFRAYAVSAGLGPNFGEKIFAVIHEEVLRQHEEKQAEARLGQASRETD